MRDYASYFIDNKIKQDKRGVSVHHDIDWWMAKIGGHLGKGLFIVLLAITGYIVSLLWQSGHDKKNFPINHVDVNGKVLITQPKDIQKILQPMLENSFFEVDINALSDKVTALPWVEATVVKRQWPDTLSIQLIERQPSYRWGSNELVDAAGNRFAKVDNHLFDDLPLIGGVDGSESQVIVAYEQLLNELGGSVERLGIKTLKLNQYLSWELHLQDGLVVKFGRDDYTQRMKRFVQAYHAGKLPAFEQLDVLDFRYYRGFAVKWKSEFLPNSAAQHLVKAAGTRI